MSGVYSPYVSVAIELVIERRDGRPAIDAPMFSPPTTQSINE